MGAGLELGLEGLGVVAACARPLLQAHGARAGDHSWTMSEASGNGEAAAAPAAAAAAASPESVRAALAEQGDVGWWVQ